MSDAPKPADKDNLITTTGDGTIELTEQELNRVVGGRKAGGEQLEYLKIKLTDVFITSV